MTIIEGYEKAKAAGWIKDRTGGIGAWLEGEMAQRVKKAMDNAAKHRPGVRRLTVAVTGGRDYRDGPTVYIALRQLDPSRVVVGDCPTGADVYTRMWARMHGVPCEVHVADWDTYGKAAGPIRNQAMLDTEDPDIILHFPGGKGTADMVKRARVQGYVMAEGEYIAKEAKDADIKDIISVAINRRGHRGPL